jgi:hypothetical protein
MTSPELERLARAIRTGADGLCSLEAACELIISTGWLHRDDFTLFIRTETPAAAGAEAAEIDWQAAITSRDTGQLHCSGGENRILAWQPASPSASPSTSATPSAASTRPASVTSSGPSVTPTEPDLTTTRTSDHVSCITKPREKRNTARHHPRETSALKSACLNHHTDPPNTVSAKRSRTHSVDVDGELAKLDADGYRPLRAAAAEAS